MGVDRTRRGALDAGSQKLGELGPTSPVDEDQGGSTWRTEAWQRFSSLEIPLEEVGSVHTWGGTAISVTMGCSTLNTHEGGLHSPFWKCRPSEAAATRWDLARMLSILVPPEDYAARNRILEEKGSKSASLVSWLRVTGSKSD